MTTYWAENAWLPTGPAAGVRFAVEDGRFARVQTRAKAAEGAPCGDARTATAATSGRGATRCMP